jgi:hypothetical protein
MVRSAPPDSALSATRQGRDGRGQNKQREYIMTNQTNNTSNGKKPAYIAYQVRDGKGDSYWTRIGAAWTSKDGKGLSLQLDTVPLDGRVVLRQADNEA